MSPAVMAMEIWKDHALPWAKSAVATNPSSGIEPKSVKAMNMAKPFSRGCGSPRGRFCPGSSSISAFALRNSPAAIESASARTVEIPMTSVSEEDVCPEPPIAASSANVVSMPSIPPNTTTDVIGQAEASLRPAGSNQPRLRAQLTSSTLHRQRQASRRWLHGATSTAQACATR